MATITETGTYRDPDGNQFWYRAGAEVSDEQAARLVLVEPADRNAGAPERREARPAPAKKPAKGE